MNTNNYVNVRIRFSWFYLDMRVRE